MYVVSSHAFLCHVRYVMYENAHDTLATNYVLVLLLHIAEHLENYCKTLLEPHQIDQDQRGRQVVSVKSKRRHFWKNWNEWNSNPGGLS